MQHQHVPANAGAMPFRQLENEICRAKNSVSILQRLVEESGTNLSREDVSLIHYAADNALDEVSELHSKIYAYFALAATIRAEAKDMPDKIQNELHAAAWHLQTAIHKSRVLSRADLKITIGLWTELIDDPACILDEHREYWKTFMADVWLFAHAAEYPERYPELRVAA